MKGFGMRILRRLEYCTRLFQSFKDERNSNSSSCHQIYHSSCSSDEPQVIAVSSEHQILGAGKWELTTDRNREVTADDGLCTTYVTEDLNDDSVFYDCVEDSTTTTTDYHNEEENYPQGEGIDSSSVILYTTSLRGIRKTFEDCRRVKFLLDSIGILYYERDVALDMKLREEVRRKLSGDAATAAILLPSLFVRGRYVGGADEVVELHEQGKLKDLFRGITGGSRMKCGGCGGVGFVMCGECNGSRKLYGNGDEKSGGGNEVLFSVCLCCNENGLIKCPVCS